MNKYMCKNPMKSNPVIINGTKYESCNQAAMSLGMSPTVVSKHYRDLMASRRSEIEVSIQSKRTWVFKKITGSEN